LTIYDFDLAYLGAKLRKKEELKTERIEKMEKW